MSTLESEKYTVDKIKSRTETRGRKAVILPEDLIRQLSDTGMGSKMITARLKVEHAIHVSYKTIQRVLKGERKPATMRGWI